MSCVKAPSLPDISAAIAILLPDLSLSIPDLSADFCCTFELPIAFTAALPLGAILAAIETALPGAIATILAAINLAVTDLNDLLDQLQFDCPLDP